MGRLIKFKEIDSALCLEGISIFTMFCFVLFFKWSDGYYNYFKNY